MAGCALTAALTCWVDTATLAERKASQRATVWMHRRGTLDDGLQAGKLRRERPDARDARSAANLTDGPRVSRRGGPRAPRRGTRRCRSVRLLAEHAAQPPRCKAEPGAFEPVVDPTRCEGQGECAVVCPYDVFEIGRMPDEPFAALPPMAKFKLWAHGRQTAFMPRVDACRACGSCVAACPEQAITLARVT